MSSSAPWPMAANNNTSGRGLPQRRGTWPRDPTNQACHYQPHHLPGELGQGKQASPPSLVGRTNLQRRPHHEVQPYSSPPNHLAEAWGSPDSRGYDMGDPSQFSSFVADLAGCPQSYDDGSSNSYGSDSRPVHVCRVCGKALRGSKQDIRRHYMTHTGEKPLSCVQCSYTTSRSSNLARHMRTMHSVED